MGACSTTRTPVLASAVWEPSLKSVSTASSLPPSKLAQVPGPFRLSSQPVWDTALPISRGRTHQQVSTSCKTTQPQSQPAGTWPCHEWAETSPRTCPQFRTPWQPPGPGTSPTYHGPTVVHPARTGGLWHPHRPHHWSL